MMRRALLPILALLSLPLLVTCGHEPSGPATPPPNPGPLEVRLTTPNADDGIMRIVVKGGAVTDVGSSDYEVQSASFGADSTVILLRGDLANGNVAEITVPDRNLLASYSAHVTQAASRQSYGLQSLVAYNVSLVNH